jgi:hypothetical protein
MVKRARGTTRPGQRPRIQRTTPRPATTTAPAPTRPLSLTPEEEARAAELEAKIVAEERAATDAQRRTRDRSRRSAEPSPEAGLRASAVPLSVRAAEEYQYVVRDVRRISLIGGGLIAFVIALWAVMQATGASL